MAQISLAQIQLPLSHIKPTCLITSEQSPLDGAFNDYHLGETKVNYHTKGKGKGRWGTGSSVVSLHILFHFWISNVFVYNSAFKIIVS
jgi:hypothetical protein